MALKFSGGFAPVAGAMKAGDVPSANAFTATTWSNDVDKISTGYALSNNQLTVDHTGSYGGGLSQHGVSSGKVYFEWVNTMLASNLLPGVGIQQLTGWSNLEGARHWEDNNGGFIWATPVLNEVFWQGSNLGAIAPSYALNDTIGIALDMDVGAVWISVNGVWANGASTAEVEASTTTNAIATGLTGTYHAAYCDGASSSDAWTATVNFGATTFTYAPAGFTGIPGATAFDALTMESGTPLATEAGVELALE